MAKQNVVSQYAVRNVGGKSVYKNEIERDCKACGKKLKVGTEVIWNTGLMAYVHVKCDTDLAPNTRQVADDDDEFAEFDDGGVDIKTMPTVKPETVAADIRAEVQAEVQRVAPRLVEAAGIVITEKLKTAMSEMLSDSVAKAAAVIDAKYAGKLDRAEKTLLDAAKKGHIKTVHEFRFPAGPVVLDGGEVYHERFPFILKLAAARVPIFMPGPTGSGKTHIGEQLARALKLDFGAISCSMGMTESKLLGRCTPNLMTGEEQFRVAEFVRIYENGGVFLFDEIDAADPTVLLVLNSAIANGVLPLDRPNNPTARRHKDFVLIAGANTIHGADRQYVGRNQIDLATLDRFRSGMVPIDYSEAVETRLCPHDELRKLFWGWREKIKSNRLERVMSTRSMMNGHKLITGFGVTVAEYADMFFCGWNDAERKKVDVLKYPKVGGEPPDADPGEITEEAIRKANDEIRDRLNRSGK